MTWLKVFSIARIGAIRVMLLGGLFGFAAGQLAPDAFRHYVPWTDFKPVGFATFCGATVGVVLGGLLGCFGVAIQICRIGGSVIPDLKVCHWLAILALATLRLPVGAAPGQQAYLKASNTGLSDTFGGRVAVSGDTIVVGAQGEDSNSTGVNGDQNNNNAYGAGAAYVFARSGTNWTQQAYLKASNTEANDYFGWSVAVSGDTVAIGAPYESSSATGPNGDPANNGAMSSGAAYVFVRNGTNWTQQAYLKASNTGANDNFGLSIALSGETLVVGAIGEASSATGVNGNQSDDSAPYSGAVYIFVRTGSNWSQQAYLKASNTGAGDVFGVSVAVSGDTLVVGATGEDGNAPGVSGNQSDDSASRAGAAYVFARNGTTWTQQAYLKASNPGADDNFGRDVAVSGDTVVVGAFGESSNVTGVNGDQTNNSATKSGAAYVFKRHGTNWNQEAYLKASNADSQDNFGWSVAVSGTTTVIGAFGEESNAVGLNGDQSDKSATNSGAAYVFVRNGTNWTQQAYVKASNTGAQDQFGCSVGISGDTVVVGALREASRATGVNGDQTDNHAPDSGAAYVFTGFEELRLLLAPDGGGGYFLRFAGAPDFTYRVERAPRVTGPWDTLATLPSPASGVVEFHDVSPLPEGAFYRTVRQ